MLIDGATVDLEPENRRLRATPSRRFVNRG